MIALGSVLRSSCRRLCRLPEFGLRNEPPRISFQGLPTYRWLSSNKAPVADPFVVLGISRAASYKQAKQAFLKLAQEHHPDKQTDSSSQDDAAFIRIRQAFEVIREGAEGQAEVTDEIQWTEDQFNEFMEEQTNEFLSFRMDHETRKEVIATFENLSPGGLDRGGTWMMARMLAERENCRIENTSPTPRQISAVAESKVKRRKRR